MKTTALPFGRVEALTEGAAIATYLVYGVTIDGILKKSAAFAVGQTVGTWIQVPGISAEMIHRYQGRVLQICEAGLDPHNGSPLFFLRVSFPLENFGGSLSVLLTALMGNDVSTALRARLLDIEFSTDISPLFPGPQMGIEDLRRLTSVYDRPMVLNMIKPCAGFSPAEGAKLFYAVAKGGVDMIKDDELLASPSYNPVLKRFLSYEKAAMTVFEENGHKPLYLPNLSGTPNQMMEQAKALVDAGCKACLVNYVFGGIDSLFQLCRAFGDKLFILAHYTGVGALSAYDCGIANSVYIGLLPRLAGAHSVMTMAPAPNNPAALYDFQKTIQAQQLPMGMLKPLITAVGGGITPFSQAFYQKELGNDAIIGIGGAIQGHPMGTTLGAQAAMTAVKATAQGISLAEAASHSPALAEALHLWGKA